MTPPRPGPASPAPADVVDFVTGSAKGYESALEHFNLSEDQLTKILADEDVHECVICGWFAPAEELSEDTDEPTCIDCLDDDD